MTTTVPHFPPLLIGMRRGTCPEVFTVQCTGSSDDSRLDGRGRTPMGYERHTVFRLSGESDVSLWARVCAVVTAFKDRYGYAQCVAVLFDYKFSAQQGALEWACDDLVNARALARYTVAIARRALPVDQGR